MTEGLHLARGLLLPLNAATQKFGIVGRSGSGKTYCSGKLAELMIAAGIQVIVLDGVGIWYGLRLGADGGAGIDIPILGGLHGDVPLEPAAGGLIADLLVDRRISAVLDVSMMRKGARKQFATLFAEQFFHRKKSSRTPVHIIIEESQMFVPQRPQPSNRRDGGISDGRMKGAFEDLTKIGRNFGIGHTLITQRPQAVDKDVLNQIEVLLAFQTNGVHEKKAIRDWMTDKGLEVNLIDELPSLEIGHAWLWSPQWLRITRKVRINKKQTADTSSTPDDLGAVVEPEPLQAGDLKHLEKAMADTIERAKADDPKVLRAEVAKLKREIKQSENKKPESPEPVVEYVDVPVLLDTQVERLLKASEAITEATRVTLAVGEEILVGIELLRNTKPTPAPVRQRRPEPRTPARPAKSTSVVPMLEKGDLKKCAWSVLAVLAQHPEGCRISKIALLAGYRISGGFRNALTALRGYNLIEGPNIGTMVITDAGMASADFRELPTGRALIDYWINHPSFKKCAREILTHLVDCYPYAKNIDDLAAATGYEISGGFRNALTSLRTAGLLDGRNIEDMTITGDLAAHI